MQEHAQEGVPHISDKPGVSGTYTNKPVRLLAVSDLRQRNIIRLKILRPDRVEEKRHIYRILHN